MSRLASVGLVLAALAALSPPMAEAQIRIGARGGINLTEAYGDDTDNITSRTGINLGAVLRFPLSDAIDLQVGAGLSARGAKDSEGDEDVDFKISYVEVPVHLRFNVPTEGSVSPHFVVGPTLGIKASCDLEISEGGSSETFDCDDPLLELDVKSIDLGASAGAGLDFELASGVAITFDALYTLGLTNLVDFADSDDTLKGRGFTFLAGVSFPVGG